MLFRSTKEPVVAEPEPVGPDSLPSDVTDPDGESGDTAVPEGE